ncbi:MAG TPA: hypothetical protein VJU87_04930 [Gemmatimonadaceae bacterium]|nr:hypothetical protein [Gemmatimonadaceae bacterium]
MLDEVVEQLTAQGVEQDTAQIARRTTTVRIRSLRTTLLERHMRPVADLARALLPEAENVSDLRMPNPEIDAEGLLNAALSMAQAASVHSEAFIMHGQSADFVARLTKAADTLRAAVDERGRARGRGVGATKSLRKLVKQGRQAVNLIQAVLRPVLLDDPKLMAEWQNARRVERRRRGGGGGGGATRSSKGASSEVTAAPPTPSASATAASEPGPASAPVADGKPATPQADVVENAGTVPAPASELRA